MFNYVIRVNSVVTLCYSSKGVGLWEIIQMTVIEVGLKKQVDLLIHLF